jgi:hypothetical protein
MFNNLLLWILRIELVCALTVEVSAECMDDV